MRNKSMLKKIIIGITAASIALSASVVTLAKTTSKGTAANRTKNVQNKKPDLKAQLDSLVKAGTITQDQEDKINSYMTQKQAEKKAEKDKVKNMTEAERKAYFEANKDKSKTDMLTELVNQKIITQDQADAIEKVMSSHPKKDKHKMKDTEDLNKKQP